MLSRRIVPLPSRLTAAAFAAALRAVLQQVHALDDLGLGPVRSPGIA
jgi:hypothetical protein